MAHGLTAEVARLCSCSSEARSEDLMGYFRNRVSDTMEAEDLVNQTWLAAGRTFKGHCTLRHYLFTIGRRLVFERWRRLKRRPWSPYNPTQVHYDESEEEHEALAADISDIDADLSDRAENHRLRNAVAQMSTPWRLPIFRRVQARSTMRLARSVRTRSVLASSRLAATFSPTPSACSWISGGSATPNTARNSSAPG
jgi:DNA-directed RNA polymerase specialized sigma24 family protein